MMMGNLGATELILIALAILLFFGAKKIPDLMGGLGKGIREFKKASREIEDDVNTDAKKIDETKKEKDHV